MKSRGLPIALLILVAIFGYSFSVFGEMSSTNFQIQWDSLNGGGDSSSSSTTYQLRDSVDPMAADTQASSSSYQLDQGYRAALYDRVADFEIFIEDRSSQVAATSVSSTTVTVTSISGFAVGDMVALVQDEGASQVTAIGKVSSASGSDVVVDEWRYTGSMPTIDGSTDYLYSLDATATSMGQLSSSAVLTAIIAWEVTADVSDGYSVYVYEDQDLTDGTDTVTDVSDGSVTLGAGEYGAVSSDDSLSKSTFDTQDTAITTTPQQVGSRSDVSFDSRDFITIKAAADGTEGSGTYSHTITVLYVGDY